MKLFEGARKSIPSPNKPTYETSDTVIRLIEELHKKPEAKPQTDDEWHKLKQKRLDIIKQIVSQTLIDMGPLEPVYHRFSCPSCKKKLRVVMEAFGQTCNCPSCGVSLEIKDPEENLPKKNMTCEECGHLNRVHIYSNCSTFILSDYRRYSEMCEKCGASMMIKPTITTKTIINWTAGAIGIGIARAISG